MARSLVRSLGAVCGKSLLSAPSVQAAKYAFEVGIVVAFYTLQAYAHTVEFEWDPDKSNATFAARGFDFAFAAGIFAGPTIEVADARRDYSEVRIRAIGETASMALVVVYTDRNDLRRIISARVANRKERAQWLSLSA